jgi:tRNA G18 (ribose-2'-O)-methylase SpoU
MQKKHSIFLILHNIRSVVNVGAMFRTAEAAGVSKIYVTGYTPAPVDRFGKKRTDFAALGAEDLVVYEIYKNVGPLITKLKKPENGSVKIIALEQAKNSVNYKKIKLTGPTAIMVGNETEGIAPALLKKADIVAEIPMQGKKESLNVGVALGVMLFQLV